MTHIVFDTNKALLENAIQSFGKNKINYKVTTSQQYEVQDFIIKLIGELKCSTAEFNLYFHFDFLDNFFAYRSILNLINYECHKNNSDAKVSYYIDGYISYDDAKTLIDQLNTKGFDSNITSGSIVLRSSENDKITALELIKPYNLALILGYPY